MGLVYLELMLFFSKNLAYIHFYLSFRAFVRFDVAKTFVSGTFFLSLILRNEF